MPDCPDFGCAICDQCTSAAALAAAAAATAPAPDSPNTADDQQVSPEEAAKTASNQITDATIVYVLGHLEDTPQVKQVDEYSGLNGYHIRTIPGKRWRNPVLVGAGGGYLAVVDRFQDYDLIRVTDKYAGAGTAGFDTDGFPIGTVDWSNLPDICSQPTPKGTQVVGLKITPQGMLVANITGLSSYVKFDVKGRVAGKVADLMEGAELLDEPYESTGNIIGNPAFVDADAGAQMFVVASIILAPDGSEAIVALIDTLQHKVIGIQGIPATPKPISATISKGVVSVLSGDNGIGSQIIRFSADLVGQGKGLLAGTHSDKTTPTPEDYTVDQFPTMKDMRKQEITPDKLHDYYRAASIINEKPNANTRVGSIPDTFDNLPAVNEASGVMNDNRVSNAAHVVVEYYGNITVPVQLIQVDPKLGLIALESDFGTVTELFNRRTLNPTTGKYTGPMDRTRPIFRVLHGAHYDITAEGGYTYGSDNTYGESDTRGASNTSGLVGESLAVDKDYELGTLKIIDAKAALVDIDSGLLLYREPKPQGGYRVYGGDYAALDAVQTNSALEVEIQALQDDITGLQTLYGGDDSPNVELQNAQAWQTTLKNRLQTLGMASTGLSRVQATTTAETAVMAVDGVQRLVTSPWVSPWLVPARAVTNGAPIAAFSTPACADDYWSLYVRQPNVSSQFDAIMMKRNWSSAYTDPDSNDSVLFPEWTASNVSPITVADSQFNFLVPWQDPQTPINYPPSLNAVGRGGFFAMSMPYVTMSNVDRYNEEAAALSNLNDAYQRVINDPSSTPAIVAQFSGYIAENSARIAYISTVPLWGDLPIIPRTVLGLQFHKIDRSNGQAAPYVPEDMTIDPTVLTDSVVGDVIPVGDEPDKNRACVTEVGPWAYVAVTVSFTADDIQDGITVYSNPEARRNGLGIRVGSWVADAESLAVWGTIGGSFYEAGYKCALFGDGAWGTWGYSIKGDAPLIPIDDLPEGGRELFVSMLAPADAQDILLEDINGDVGDSYDEVFYKTHYFLTRAPLHSIAVKIWLRHHAADVHRWGWQTLSHNYPRVSPLCPSIDPGYNTGVENILEAPGCGGTLSGASTIFNSDPTYTQLGHDVMQGTAIFECVPNPYEALGLAYGTIWKCEVDFSFNNNLRALDVPLLPSDVETPGT